MTEIDIAVTEVGRSFSKVKMDVSKRIIRNLEPARPLRRLNMNQVSQSYSEMKPVEKPDNIIKVEHFYEILHLQSTSTQASIQASIQASTQASTQPKKKAERICYTRDFLFKLASTPMAKRKPEFLPEHPIVLENGKINDVPKYYYNNNNNEDLTV